MVPCEGPAPANTGLAVAEDVPVEVCLVGSETV